MKLATYLVWGLANALSPTAVTAQSSDIVLRALKDIGAQPIREIATDTCFPATAAEYVALGKHAIIRLKTSSAISTELPLRSVYIVYKGVRVPLQRIALLQKNEDATTSRAEQTSFYLLPIQMMKNDAQMLADFTGDRKAFSIMSFSAKTGLDSDAPAFASLDEYDTPNEADDLTVKRVLIREYPDDIK